MQELSKVKSNILFKIKEIKKCCPFKIKRRLLDLGFLPETELKVIKKSLLSKVLLIEIRGYCLSLQTKIADYIIVGG